MQMAVLTILRSVFRIALYGHLWVAFGALVMCWQTQLLLVGTVKWEPLPAFIFAATLWLYSLHRLIALQKSGEPGKIDRRCHVLLAVLSGLVAAVFLWQMPWSVWYYLLPGALMALAYILPVFGHGRRLRDLPYFKTALIVLAWSWITVAVPAAELGMHYHLPALLLMAERMGFIFAIAIAFDIRDEATDRQGGVRTIPGTMGWRTARYLAQGSLLLSASVAWFAFRLSVYSTATLLGLYLSLLISIIVIGRTYPQRSPFFFAAWVDGLMIIQFIWVWMGSRIG